MEQELAMQRLVVAPHRDQGCGAAAKDMGSPAGVDHRQRTDGDDALEEKRCQHRRTTSDASPDRIPPRLCRVGQNNCTLPNNAALSMRWRHGSNALDELGVAPA